MFEVTGDDIALLNDVDLRTLVALLCEAELSARGLSPAAVTWGGSQTAADGGLDVRVALPEGTEIDGFVPRFSTGFQVKKPDMPKSAILKEVRPNGKIRPVILALAQEEGAYIIVSSNGSTADSTLGRRKAAIREAVGVSNSDRLYTDFYDRTRLASWVRCHPGVIVWVKGKIGRAVTGWRPYGAWSGGMEDATTKYLLDDKLSLHLGRRRDELAQSVIHAIDALRDELALPRKVIRLVGLSGVGKTRLAQALFEADTGARFLPPSLAIYTNLSDSPNPQPVGLATDLIANHTRAILVVDNCPPDLHRRLSELCVVPDSTLSVLTIEYDVRDDQPEQTQVVWLETSSYALIEKLLRRRYPHLSQVDSSTIATASGGNARIAIALAETVGKTESIAGLSDDDLFQRLFRQRHGSDSDLLLAAQACSLLYSFEGETLSGEDAEIPYLASLVGQEPREVYRHISELFRRDLIQRRGKWRAILPHAIANRLAARALEDIPYESIERQLIESGSGRMAQSFSRRLAFLHYHPEAIRIAERWLEPGGLLGDVAALDVLRQAMFENIAPILPESTLTALERVDLESPELSCTVWSRYGKLLRSLAYDSALFSRSVYLLARAATNPSLEIEAKETKKILVSLFTLQISGTHATVEQRLLVIGSLVRSPDQKSRSLGFSALDVMLAVTHFTSTYQFEFGARSRDHGYSPKSYDEVLKWSNSVLELIEHLVESEFLPELRSMLARRFRSLWTVVRTYDHLEKIARLFVTKGFWEEGWEACRRTLRFDKLRMDIDAYARLSKLEFELKPTTLMNRVRAFAIGNCDALLELGEQDANYEMIDELARSKAIDKAVQDLGTEVAADRSSFESLVPDLLRGGRRIIAFGRGLANSLSDPKDVWDDLHRVFCKIPPQERSSDLLKGFIAEVWRCDRELAQNFLDFALADRDLVIHFPVLQAAVELDERGIDRLKKSATFDAVPVNFYQFANIASLVTALPGRDLHELLISITGKADGFRVAIENLSMRIFSDRVNGRVLDSAVTAAGQALLLCLKFKCEEESQSYEISEVIKTCFAASEAAPIAAQLALRLKHAVATRQTYAFTNYELLEALLVAQPIAVLNVIFDGDKESRRQGLDLFANTAEFFTKPARVLSCESLTEWCKIDPETRYPLAARIVPLSQQTVENGQLEWTEQALMLLSSAPVPEAVLMSLIEQFNPTVWTGSRATTIESNIRLLETLEPLVSVELALLVSELKISLSKDALEERRWETKREKGINEAFE
jgi:hypothetical protein